MAKTKAIALTGNEALQMLLATASGGIVEAVGGALFEEGQLAMRDSLNEVPVKDAILKGSAEIKPPKFSNGRVKVTLGYGGAAAAYALIRHNTPASNYTKPGTKDHYLSDPVQKRIPMIQKTLHGRVAKLLGRAAGTANAKKG